MAVLVLASVASAQQGRRAHFETVWIPLTETPSPGSPREVKLEGMLYRPPAPGRLPVLGCDRTTRFNADTFAEAGRAGKLPMLWLYSENDRNYGPGAVQSYHRVFIQGGGTAELQIYPPIGHDGHILLPGAVTVWQTAVQSFLAKVGFDQPRN
jgi:pimeloyl-ACP methyl ester carboxylesterase